MKIGYARVSTTKQGKDGNSLEVQRELLLENGAVKIYEEKFTGTKKDRPELNKLLKELNSGDELIVTKLDRIARSASQGMELIQQLIDKAVRVNVLNMGVLDDTPTGKLIVNIMFAFAEFERNMIIERTAEGKAIAKQNPDFKEGRPKKFTKKQLAHALGLLENNTYREVSEITGISVSTLIRAKQQQYT
jgi:DNA invertase Pin-like site-specific DNA recombinase